MKVTLIEFGVKNKNGRTYLQPNVLDLPKTVTCTLDHVSELNPSFSGPQTCGMADITMDTNGMYAEVKPFSEAKGKLFEELMMNGAKVVAAGTGRVNEKGEVENYCLHYVFLTNEPS